MSLGPNCAVAESDKAKEGAANANALALQAQLALERFKAPRIITPVDQPGMIAQLIKYRGTKVAIYIWGEGVEPNALAGSIKEILDKSQWEALRWNWVGVSSAPGLFVIAEPGSSPEVEAARDGLVRAFNDAHLHPQIDTWPGEWDKFGGMLNGPNPPAPTDAPLRIVVGSKPQ